MWVNWNPEGKPRYVYGFCNIDAPPNLSNYGPYDPSRHHTAHPGVIGSPARYSMENVSWLGGQDPCDVIDRLGLAGFFYVHPVEFVAFAIGNVDDDDDLDVWSIDSRRNVTHVLAD